MVLRRLIAVGLATLVAGLAIFSLRLRDGNEPRYEGRTLSSWFGELCRVSTIFATGGQKAGDVYPRILECKIAILEMGTNAVPFLVREAFTPSRSALRELAYSLSMRLPEWAGRGVVQPPGRRSREAGSLLEVLRPPAPLLLPLLEEPLASTNERIRAFAVRYLASAPDEAGISLPVLEETIAQLQDPRLRSLALSAAARSEEASLNPKVARLIARELLNLPSMGYRVLGMAMLARMGSEAASEAGTLRPFLRDPDDTLRIMAAAALIYIVPGEPEALEILRRSADPDARGSGGPRPWELLCQAAFQIQKTNDWMVALIEPLARVEAGRWTRQYAMSHAIEALRLVGPQYAAEVYRSALQGPNPVAAASGLLRIEPTNAVATKILLEEIARSSTVPIARLSDVSSENTEAMTVLQQIRDDPSRPHADRLAARVVLAGIRWRELCGDREFLAY